MLYDLSRMFSFNSIIRSWRIINVNFYWFLIFDDSASMDLRLGHPHKNLVIIYIEHAVCILTFTFSIALIFMFNFSNANRSSCNVINQISAEEWWALSRELFSHELCWSCEIGPINWPRKNHCHHSLRQWNEASEQIFQFRVSESIQSDAQGYWLRIPRIQVKW